jgi:hypothetical protein
MVGGDTIMTKINFPWWWLLYTFGPALFCLFGIQYEVHIFIKIIFNYGAIMEYIFCDTELEAANGVILISVLKTA